MACPRLCRELERVGTRELILWLPMSKKLAFDNCGGRRSCMTLRTLLRSPSWLPMSSHQPLTPSSKSSAKRMRKRGVLRQEEGVGHEEGVGQARRGAEARGTPGDEWGSGSLRIVDREYGPEGDLGLVETGRGRDLRAGRK